MLLTRRARGAVRAAGMVAVLVLLRLLSVLAENLALRAANVLVGSLGVANRTPGLRKPMAARRSLGDFIAPSRIPGEDAAELDLTPPSRRAGVLILGEGDGVGGLLGAYDGVGRLLVTDDGVDGLLGTNGGLLGSYDGVDGLLGTYGGLLGSYNGVDGLLGTSVGLLTTDGGLLGSYDGVGGLLGTGDVRAESMYREGRPADGVEERRLILNNPGKAL